MRLVHSKTMSERLGGKDGDITRDRERVIVRETGSENERREERDTGYRTTTGQIEKILAKRERM